MPEAKDILERLRSQDTTTIREGAFEAAEAGLVEAVPHLVSLLSSHNLGVQEAADQALRKIGGKETVEGVAPLLRSDDAPSRNLAMDILREVGDQHFPSLVELVHDEDPDIRIFATDILGSTDNLMAVDPLCEALLKDPEVNVRYQAAVSLGDLAKPEAAKCLNKAMEDDEWVQYAVIEALSKIKHASSVGALAKALNHSSDLVASMIIDALGEMGNIQAVTMLLRKMEQSPTALRNKIVKAIVGILGGKSLTLLSRDERERFKEYMLVALKDEDHDIQDAAIQGLAFVGGEKASAKVMALAAAMDPDMDHDRLNLTLGSLSKIGLTDALKQGLASGDPATQRVAVEVMAMIDGPKVSEVLMDAFWTRDRDLQRDMAGALATVAGPEAKDFFMDVLDRHKDGTVIKTALKFLGGKMRFKDTGPRLLELLEHPYNDVKEAALEACVAIGGQSMKDRFCEMAAQGDPLHRLMALYALGELASGDCLDLLAAGLEDEVPDIRKVSLEAVSNIVADTAEWLGIVRSRMHDENKEVRLTLTELMGRRFNDEIIPYLVEALDDDDDWVRIRAVEALGEHGEPKAIPKLVPLLEADNKLVVMKVIDALGDIGGEAAFKSLLEVTGSDDPDLAQAAEQAIAKIQSEQGEER